jgi:hypothetical protein
LSTSIMLARMWSGTCLLSLPILAMSAQSAPIGT